jgi:phage-related protein
MIKAKIDFKKTQKTPNQDRALALRRKNAYLNNG